MAMEEIIAGFQSEYKVTIICICTTG